MLFRRDLAGGQRLAAIHRRQDAGVVALVGCRRVGDGIASLLIDRPVTVKDNNTATGAQHDALRAVGNINRCLVQFGGFHLAGNGPLPDQVVQALLIVIEIGADLVRRPADVGRTDGLVSFLCVGGSRLVDPRAVRQVAVAETLADLAANRGKGLAAKLYAVCPHIGDETRGLGADIHTFIEFLRNLHRAAGRKAKLA